MGDGQTDNRRARGEPDFDALIIGAGFAGLYQLHLLRDRLGLSVRVLEAQPGIGGTWQANRYPGARCDSESHSYCYFFSPEIYRAWEWSERYPGQAEILRYLEFVTERLDLMRDISLGVKVTAARFDDATNLWIVETDRGESLTCTWLITAVGCLSSANIPDIPGLSDFAGDWYHTGQWPHEGVDLAGKRVGQIGTGSTGIQAAPAIAAQAAHLTVFQRTANYSVPARNAPLGEARKRYFKEHFEEIRDIVQRTPNGHPFEIAKRKVLDVDDDERRRLYEEAWETGGLRFRAVFQDLLASEDANATAAAFIKGKIRQIVHDPRKARILSDIDHPYAAKRPPVDTEYFETFNRDNVDLVDLRAEPITRITGNGILTEKAEYPLDVIVFATGFDAMTGPLLRLGLTGRGGLRLDETWAAGPVTYLGLQIPGFPNLFTVTGPGSPSVLVNLPIGIEQHVEWITDCIAFMRERGVTRIEPRIEAATAWGAHVEEAAGRTLLPQAPHSWYLGANVPGKPRVFMPYTGGMGRYRAICDDIAARGYPGFILDDTAQPAPAAGDFDAPVYAPGV